MLTYMLTLSTWVEIGWVRPWELSGTAMPERSFYYAKPWRDAVDRLPGAAAGLVRSGSARARVLGFVERYVAGDDKAKLVRPQGDAMNPPFERMRHPHSVVVEMRTFATRSFGFFSQANVFVALFLEETDALKRAKAAGTDRYKAYADKVEILLSKLTKTDVDGVTDVDQLVTDRR
jgi:hypothetical protein